MGVGSQVNFNYFYHEGREGNEGKILATEEKEGNEGHRELLKKTQNIFLKKFPRTNLVSVGQAGQIYLSL